MIRKEYQVDIAKPCTENWAEMTAGQQGRYCSSCQKTVVDLTTMTNRQIVHAYENAGGELCGRAMQSQLNQPFTLESKYIQKTKWRAFAALVTGVLGFGHLQGQLPVVEVTASQVMQKTHSSVCHVKLVDENTTEKITISGRVIDGDSGADIGLPFANVVVEIDGRFITGTTTDVNGYYLVDVEEINASYDIRVVYVGFLDQLIKGLEAENNELAIPEIKMISPMVYSTMGLVHIERSPKKRISYALKRPYYKLRNAVEQGYWNWQENKKERTENRLAKKEARQAARQQETPQPEITEIVTIDGIGKRLSTPKETPTTVYPNPFDNELTVALDTEQASTDMQLVLFDVNGVELVRKIVTANQGKNEFEFDVSRLDLPCGSYFLSVFNGQEIIRTVIVEKID